MAELQAGRKDALQVLHRRYAPLVFHIACRSLDRPAAEEITQDVFLQVWQKAGSFDPSRGGFRSWMLQIAHRRILNELRQRGRRPRLVEDPDESAGEVAAPDPGPEEQAWGEYRSTVIRQALDSLPPEQGRALRLAFFQELTHEEVAAFLSVPVGTAKSRIRVALEKLNPRLAVLVAGLIAALGWSAYRGMVERRNLAWDEGALDLLTGSHVEALRLVPPGAAGDIEGGPHANYRAERGRGMAVFSLSKVPALPEGETYRLWRRKAGLWSPLGELRPDAQGRGRLILENSEPTWPEGLILVREKAGPAGPAPNGAPFLAWPSGAPPLGESSGGRRSP